MRVVRAVLLSLLAIVAFGGIPGSALRATVPVFVAPPVPAQVNGRDGVVQVLVRDAGVPVAGAHVRALAILDEKAYLGAERDTDASGHAKLVGLPRAETWILADSPGKARASTHLVVDGEMREVTLDLAPGHALDVLVRDDASAPVPAAEIEVASSSDPLPVGARSGEDGKAHVGRLGVGPWRVTARAAGYDEATQSASNEGDAVVLSLKKLGALVVHTVDEEGGPVAHARVEVSGVTMWPARVTESDGRGDVRISGLAAGAYAMRATDGDRVSPIELGVLLARGEEKEVTLRLGPGHWVAVRVTDGDAEDADPIGAARVSLAEGGLSPFPIEAVTDAKGGARLGPIAPGTATVAARADGFVSRGAVPVADPPPALTRIALVRAGVLTGRVVDARGYPVAGATIEIVGTDPTGAPIVDDPRRANFQSAHFDAMLRGPTPLMAAGELGVVPGPVPPIPHQGGSTQLLGAPVVRSALEEEWVTRDDGTFRAAPASPGRVRAIVRHPEYVEAQSDVVTLAPGGEAHVDVVLHAGGTLEGRLVDSRERPVEGALIVVAALRGSLERSTRTASDGTFAFASLPDEVTLTASVDDSDDQPDLHATASIPEDGRQTITLHLPSPRAPLAVKVVDERGKPVQTAQISASSLSPESPLRTTAFTDDRGEASLKRARGLPLRIEVSAPRHAPHVVTADGSEETLRIVLSPAETATGEVVSAHRREAIAGADVTLYTDLGVRRARTDGQGAFTLTQLSSGAAKLRVRAAGFAPTTRELDVPDDGGRHAFELPRVELAEEGVVEGEVVDGRGDPVAGARVARDHVPTWLVVGATPPASVVTHAKGRFVLRELDEGSVTLEAFYPDLGRARADAVKVTAGRTTSRVRLTLTREGDAADREAMATGSVAVTLGETGEPVDVGVVSVADGSEAERAGMAPGDILTSVDGAAVHTMHEARAKLSGPVADDVVVELQREGRAVTLRVRREPVRR